MLLLLQPIRHNSKVFLKGRMQDQAERSNWLETRNQYHESAKKSLEINGNNCIPFKKIPKQSFPESHFLLNILWPWLLRGTYFFPLPVYFVYLAALSIQAIVLLMVSKAYLLIKPSRYCSNAVLQDLDEHSSQTLREAASQQREQSWTQQATMSRHVRTQKGNGWA